MLTQSVVAAPVWMRAVAVLAVVWNVFGVLMYLSSVGVVGDPTTGFKPAEPPPPLPAWVTAAFAIGTFAGLIGSIGLLVRKAWAMPVLVVSLLALLALEGWMVFSSGAKAAFGVTAPIMPIVISVIAVFLAWVAAHARAKGWLS